MKEWLGEKLKQKHINQAEYQELTETIDRMFAPVGEPAPQYDEYQQQIDENVNYMNVAQSVIYINKKIVIHNIDNICCG